VDTLKIATSFAASSNLNVWLKPLQSKAPRVLMQTGLRLEETFGAGFSGPPYLSLSFVHPSQILFNEQSRLNTTLKNL
jgi:hypothetical protein